MAPPCLVAEKNSSLNHLNLDKNRINDYGQMPEEELIEKGGKTGSSILNFAAKCVFSSSHFSR